MWRGARAGAARARARAAAQRGEGPLYILYVPIGIIPSAMSRPHQT